MPAGDPGQRYGGRAVGLRGGDPAAGAGLNVPFETSFWLPRRSRWRRRHWRPWPTGRPARPRPSQGVDLRWTTSTGRRASRRFGQRGARVCALPPLGHDGATIILPHAYGVSCRVRAGDARPRVCGFTPRSHARPSPWFPAPAERFERLVTSGAGLGEPHGQRPLDAGCTLWVAAA